MAGAVEDHGRALIVEIVRGDRRVLEGDVVVVVLVTEATVTQVRAKIESRDFALECSSAKLTGRVCKEYAQSKLGIVMLTAAFVLNGLVGLTVEDQGRRREFKGLIAWSSRVNGCRKLSRGKIRNHAIFVRDTYYLLVRSATSRLCKEYEYRGGGNC